MTGTYAAQPAIQRLVAAKLLKREPILKIPTLKITPIDEAKARTLRDELGLVAHELLVEDISGNI